MQKILFKSFPFYLLQVPVLLFLMLHSCKNESKQLDVLIKKLEVHQDSMNQVFFIPTKKNLKSELTFYHEQLFNLKKISSVKIDSLKRDSVLRFLNNQIEKTKGWTNNLENYDLQKIIEEQFTKDIFIEKNYPNQVPLFYEKGKVVLKKESLSKLDLHIQKQIQTYWFLKKELGENEPIQIATKDFIGFLNSIKMEREFLKN